MPCTGSRNLGSDLAVVQCSGIADYSAPTLPLFPIAVHLGMERSGCSLVNRTRGPLVPVPRHTDTSASGRVSISASCPLTVSHTRGWPRIPEHRRLCRNQGFPLDSSKSQVPAVREHPAEAWSAALAEKPDLDSQGSSCKHLLPFQESISAGGG